MEISKGKGLKHRDSINENRINALTARVDPQEGQYNPVIFLNQQDHKVKKDWLKYKRASRYPSGNRQGRMTKSEKLFGAARFKFFIFPSKPRISAAENKGYDGIQLYELFSVYIGKETSQP